jgi:hypothetical protein
MMNGTFWGSIGLITVHINVAIIFRFGVWS